MCCLFIKTSGQDKVVLPLKTDTAIIKPSKPEILTSGFIDVVNSGQVNASARLLRLLIGEPGRLAIPISIYSGVSSSNFQSQQVNSFSSNNVLIPQFINPLSGLVNLSIDNLYFFPTKKKGSTKAGMLYQTGIKVLTGYKTGVLGDPFAGSPVNFLNSFATIGFYFQTGAWDRNNKNNLGVFWSSLRLIGSVSNPKQIEQIIATIKTNGFYYGYSFGCGVEISSLVNLKILYYKYIKAPEHDFGLPIYQFSFNYALK